MFAFMSGKQFGDGDITRRLSAGLKSMGPKGEKRQITRNRTSYSCVACRRRKVRCDKVHPICGNCQKANETCTYAQDEPAATTATSAGAPNQAKSVVSEPKKRRLSPGKQSLSPPTSTSTSTSLPTRSSPPTDLKAIEEQLRRLTAVVDSLRQSAAPDAPLPEILTPGTSHHSDPDPDDGVRRQNGGSLTGCAPPDAGHDAAELSKPLSELTLTNGGPSSVEDALWKHVSDEVDQLNIMMRRRNNLYISSLNVQNKQCDANHGGLAVQEDDFWATSSFHALADATYHHHLDGDSPCPVCSSRPLTKQSLLQSSPIRVSPAAARHRLERALPSRTQSHVLLRGWLTGVHPILPLVPPADIIKKHDEFWDGIEAGTALAGPAAPDLDFLALIHAIWYAGSLSISLKGLQRWFPATPRAQLCTRFHDQVIFCLHLGRLASRPSLEKLASLILLQAIPVAEEELTQSSLYVHLIVRMAQAMGLHREPTRFDLPAVDEAIRRAIWWQVVQLDITLVVTSGYPTQIAETFTDTKLSGDGTDADRDDAAWSRPGSVDRSPSALSAEGATQPTTPLVAQATARLTCAFRAVIAIHLSTKPLTKADLQDMRRVITEACDYVDRAMKLIPAKGLPELGFVPPVSRDPPLLPLDCDTAMGSPIAPDEVALTQGADRVTGVPSPLVRYHRSKLAAYNRWARIGLSTMKDKLQCVAYAPFLKNNNSKIWTIGRQCGLRNCHSFMRKFVSLAQDPDLEPFRWSWAAMFAPMHASMIMLIDLYERPHSVEAPRARELIDNMFSLAAPASNIVGGANGVTVQRPMREGGVDAWYMLRGLRSAAWQKAGLDPQFLWTEADQLAVGLAQPLTEAQKVTQSLREDSIYEKEQRPRSDGDAEQTSTEEAIRGLVKMAHTELQGAALPSGNPDPATTCEGVHMEVDSESRRDPDRPLASRGGQQLMPFPLGSVHERLLRSVRHGVIEPDSNRPLASEAAADAGKHGRTNGEIEQTLNIVAPANQMAPEQPPDPTSPRLHFGDGTASDVSKPNSAMLSSFPLPHVPPPETQINADLHPDADLGFDWERWDAVFGQYSGFTEMMEDVTWEEDGDYSHLFA